MNDAILGAGNERLSQDGQVSRFRPRYRALDPAEIALHDAIKDAASALETLIESTPLSRERSIAITKLEEAIMWAVKGLTGPKPPAEG